MVLVKFEIVLHCFDWFGLVLRKFCVKEMMKFSKELLSKTFKTPVFVLSIS